jgi:hypothetical protein
MLIDYSMRAWELLGRKLDEREKAEIFGVFHRVGARMGLKGLPPTYQRWKIIRNAYLETNLVRSTFTLDLYKQYKRHLGVARYYILLQAQALLVPEKVRRLLRLSRVPVLYPAFILYKATRHLRFDRLIKALLLPRMYKVQIAGLNRS